LLVPINGRPASDVTASNGAITSGTVAAFKVMSSGTGVSLQPGWTSRDLASPVTPVTVNGVVFALSSGAPANAGTGDLSKSGAPAVLYALDGKTGKELWTSGKTMTSFETEHSFWSANGQIYVGTYDGTIYAFGFAMERNWH
jgi:outer membrane protein assembly factor BamB